jgi:uncharacterized protein YvpB
MRSFLLKTILITLFASLLIVAGILSWQKISQKKQTYPEYVTDKQIDLPVEDSVSSNREEVPPAIDPPKEPSSETLPPPLPGKVLLDLPFTTQAPLANWDPIHEETCEEASLLMVWQYKNKTTFGTTQNKDKELLEMVAFENSRSYGASITLAELDQIAKDYLDLRSGRIVKDVSLDDIKREIASGRPVILPAAGKLLQNPNFRNGGPVYHMLVIRGYDEKGFITNDPGTRKGENYRYSFDTIMNSLHDWNSSDIQKGEKNILVYD